MYLLSMCKALGSMSSTTRKKNPRYYRTIKFHIPALLVPTITYKVHCLTRHGEEAIASLIHNTWSLSSQSKLSLALITLKEITTTYPKWN